MREVIFPAAGQGTLEAVARDARTLGIPHSRRVQGAVRASYGFYYRRMMPRFLAALDFRSNNGAHRPVLDALAAVRRAEGEGRQYIRDDEVAVEGVVRPKWRDIVLEDAPGGGQRVTRRRSCAASPAATPATQPTGRSPSSAKRPKPCSSAATSTRRRCGARSTKG